MITLQGVNTCCFRCYSIRSFHTTQLVRTPAKKHDSVKEIPNHYSHYQVLGISKTADSKEVKTAFRKLSKKFHPDMNQRTSPKKKKVINNNYLKIVESYEVLSNNERRQKYDRSIQSNTNNHGPIRSWKERDFTNNTYYQDHKSYSAGGINRSRGRVHYGPGFQEAKTTYSNFDRFTSATGSNYDVPHFDYDHHLKGTLLFERRMINKRIHKLYEEHEIEKQEKGKKSEKERAKEKYRDKMHDEINDILNLQRYGALRARSERQSDTTSSSAKAVILVGTIGLIAVGGMLLH